MNVMIAYAYIKAFAQLVGVSESYAIKLIQKHINEKGSEQFDMAVNEIKIQLIHNRSVDGYDGATA